MNSTYDRAVFVGGLLSSRISAEGVGNVLGDYFKEVEVFTFSDSINQPEVVKNASYRAALFTHSAGALALLDTGIEPGFIHLLNPPLPRSKGALVVSAFVEAVRVIIPSIAMHNLDDYKTAAVNGASAVTETLLHPIANLGQILNIARFDAIQAAANANHNGLQPSRIAWTTHDIFFQPSAADYVRASSYQIPISMQDGEHDEAVLRPSAFFNKFFES